MFACFATEAIMWSHVNGTMVTRSVTREKSDIVQTVHGSHCEEWMSEFTYCINSYGDSAGADTLFFAVIMARVFEICKADGMAFLWTPLSENESRAADGVSFDCAASVLSLAFKRL